MNRRAFLGALLGVGAAAATEAVAPSLVWPFRKYFLPANWKHWIGYDWAGNLVGGDNPFGVISPGSVVATQGFTHISNNGIFTVTDAGTENVLFDKPIPDLRLAEEYVEAVELEVFAKQIPDLLNKGNLYYELFKSRAMQMKLNPRSRMRVPIRAYAVSEKDQKCADAVNQLLEMKNGNSIEVPFKVLPEEQQNRLLARAGIFPAHQEEPDDHAMEVATVKEWLNTQPKRGLLHKKATLENIVRFVDELQSKG